MRKMHRLCFNQLHGLEAQSPPKRPRSMQEKNVLYFWISVCRGYEAHYHISYSADESS